jgi:hypothetical protein
MERPPHAVPGVVPRQARRSGDGGYPSALGRGMQNSSSTLRRQRRARSGVGLTPTPLSPLISTG